MSPTSPPLLPRVARAALARQRYPDLFRPLTAALHDGDPLADACVSELSALPRQERDRVIDAALRGDRLAPQGLLHLVEHCADFPAWVDPDRIHRAGRILRRAGILGGLTLGLKSLVLGYAAPAGNKPLALTGALTARADRRLAETARFVASVCEPGGLEPRAEGFRTTLRVRLMHAAVRQLCDKDPRYNAQRYGRSINQHDMLATILLFSWVFIQGIRQLGVAVTEQEEEDYVHLFRLVGHLIGVSGDLLPRDVADARRRAEFIQLTQGRPDEDSRALTRALLEGPLRQASGPAQLRLAQTHVTLATQLCRDLIGQELADQLLLPRGSRLRPTLAVRSTIHLLELLRQRSSSLSRKVEEWGAGYYDFSVRRGLAGGVPRFALPERLEG